MPSRVSAAALWTTVLKITIVVRVVAHMYIQQRRLDKHLYGLYARVWENSGMQLFFSAKSSEVKVSNFKQLLQGSVKVREVFKVIH